MFRPDPLIGDDRVFAKCAWRLIPLVIAGYLINFLDRTNLGFAALTMNKDLGFSPSVYGLGSGLFFLSYSDVGCSGCLLRGGQLHPPTH